MPNIIILHFGSAEDGKFGSVIATSNMHFATEQKALSNLAISLYDVFKERFWREEEVCETCGHQLNMDPKVLEEAFYTDFENWLNNLPNITNDKFGYSDMNDWNIGVSPVDIIGVSLDDIILVAENAAQKLSNLAFKNKKKHDNR